MKLFARFTGALLSLAVIIGSIYGITHRQEILDYLALRNYTPSERVVALANDRTMQDGTRGVFYANHPQLDNKEAFRNN